jgi:hypothetical protein
MRIIGGITQSLAQLVDGEVHAVVEVHERIIRPQLLAQLFSRDQLTGMLDQHREHLTGLLLQLDPLALSVKFPSAQIQLELIKAPQARRIGGVRQRRQPLRESIAQRSSRSNTKKSWANPFKLHELTGDRLRIWKRPPAN